MKDKLLTIVRSLAALLALTIVFSLIFSALYYFHVISQSLFHILNWIFGAIAFAFAGILLGLGINKKALLHAFCIVCMLALFGFLWMSEHTLIASIEFISKLLLYIVGCLFSFNRKSTS